MDLAHDAADRGEGHAGVSDFTLRPVALFPLSDVPLLVERLRASRAAHPAGSADQRTHNAVQNALCDAMSACNQCLPPA